MKPFIETPLPDRRVQDNGVVVLIRQRVCTLPAVALLLAVPIASSSRTRRSQP